jgi:hypothetical protein
VAAVKMMAALVNVGIRPDAAAEYYPPLVQDGEARMWAAPQLWLVLERCPRGVEGCDGTACQWTCADCGHHNCHEVFCYGCGAGCPENEEAPARPPQTTGALSPEPPRSTAGRGTVALVTEPEPRLAPHADNDTRKAVIEACPDLVRDGMAEPFAPQSGAFQSQTLPGQTAPLRSAVHPGPEHCGTSSSHQHHH